MFMPPPPPEPAPLTWVLVVEPFDLEAFPGRGIPPSPFVGPRPGRPSFNAPVARPPVRIPLPPRPRAWLHPVPDGLVALVLDIAVSAAGGHGSFLQSRATWQAAGLEPGAFPRSTWNNPGAPR